MRRQFVALGIILACSATPLHCRAANPDPSWRIAYVHNDDIWLARGDGKDRKLLVKNGRAPAWSPDRKQLAFVRDGDIWLIRLRDRRLRRLTTGWKAPRQVGFHGGKEASIAWDPVSGNLYVSRWEEFLIRRPGDKSARSIAVSSIFEISSKGGKPIPRLDLLEEEAQFRTSINAHPAFSRDGNRMAFMRNGDVWLAERERDAYGRDAYKRRWIPWDMTRLEAAADYDAPNWRGSRWNLFVTGLSLSPDGARLVYCIERVNGSGQQDIELLRLSRTEGQDQVVKTTTIADGFDPVFSRDGKWIVYWQPDGIHAISADGKGDRLLIPDGREPVW